MIVPIRPWHRTDMGELGLYDHLGNHKCHHLNDADDFDDFDDDDDDDVKDTGLKRAISAGLPSTKMMFTISFPM